MVGDDGDVTPNDWAARDKAGMSLRVRQLARGPFVTLDTPAQVQAAFRRWAERVAARNPDWLAPLRGRPLGCSCPLPAPGEPDHCHAGVLLELVAELEAPGA